MGGAGNRQILFVAGMHRAGTSALCAALHACGARFGTRLLQPMPGVNDEGFWEDPAVIEINEALLSRADASWFSATTAMQAVDWQSAGFADLRGHASEILHAGDSAAALTVIKDPRLCLTLPFWRSLCVEQAIPATVCLVWRAPMEIARSLQARDDFPLGFGLRLVEYYLRAALSAAGDDPLRVTYQELLDTPVDTLRRLARQLPLEVDAAALGRALNPALRHQRREADSASPLHAAQWTDQDDIHAELARLYPLEQTLDEMTAVVVRRGRELTRIGAEHTQALATLDERDEQIRDFDDRLQAIGALHSTALATIEERDGQLAQLNELYQQALQNNREIRAEVERLFSIPLLGPLLRVAGRYARR